MHYTKQEEAGLKYVDPVTTKAVVEIMEFVVATKEVTEAALSLMTIMHMWTAESGPE